MIYAALTDAARYLGLDAHLDTALHYILDNDLNALPLGRTEVDGDAVFINVAEFEAKPLQGATFEGHRRYTDIHIPLEGAEEIAVARLGTLEELGGSEERDFFEYDGRPEAAVALMPGFMLITFPEDLHRPGVRCTGETHVKKAVFKVLVG